MRIFLFLVPLLLCGCAGSPGPTASTPAPSAPLPPVAADAKGKLHPPTGVESVALGASEAQVEAAWGKAEAVDKNEFNPKQSYWLYYSKGVEVSFNEGKLDSIVCHNQDDKYKAYPGATSDGLWVGSTRADFEKVLGKPPGEPLAQALKYGDKGLWIRFGTDGKTESISVMNPGS